METNHIRRSHRWAGLDVLLRCSSLPCQGKGHGRRVKGDRGQVDENLAVFRYLNDLNDIYNDLGCRSNKDRLPSEFSSSRSSSTTARTLVRIPTSNCQTHSQTYGNPYRLFPQLIYSFGTMIILYPGYFPYPCKFTSGFSANARNLPTAWRLMASLMTSSFFDPRKNPAILTCSSLYTRVDSYTAEVSVHPSEVPRLLSQIHLRSFHSLTANPSWFSSSAIVSGVPRFCENLVNETLGVVQDNTGHTEMV